MCAYYGRFEELAATDATFEIRRGNNLPAYYLTSTATTRFNFLRT
jgi:hypothetical protein